MRSILSSSVALAAILVTVPALAQQLPAVKGYPQQISRCGDQLEPAVGYDCLTGSYQAAFRETGSPFAGGMSVWTHNHNNPLSFLKNSGDSGESFSPSIRSHVVWADFHLRDPGNGSSEINLNRVFQPISLTPGADQFPQITDMGGCCGSGITWQTHNLTWDVMYRSMRNGLGSLVGVGDEPGLTETRPVISAVRGRYAEEIGGEVTMAWQAAQVDHNYPYMPPHHIKWAILDAPGNTLDKDTIPSGMDARHPAIDGTLVCYDAAWYGDPDRRVYCRDIGTEEGRNEENDELFLVPTDERCGSYSRPRVSKSGRFVIYLAERCESESGHPKQLHLTDLHTGNAYIVVDDFPDDSRYPDSPTVTRVNAAGRLEEVPTISMNYRYDIHDDMIVYSILSEKTAEMCKQQYGSSYGTVNFDLHYFLIDTAAL